MPVQIATENLGADVADLKSAMNTSRMEQVEEKPIFEFDRAAESKLRLKIDLYIVPTVALIYLFCFIDRANIGKS